MKTLTFADGPDASVEAGVPIARHRFLTADGAGCDVGRAAPGRVVTLAEVGNCRPLHAGGVSEVTDQTPAPSVDWATIFGWGTAMEWAWGWDWVAFWAFSVDWNHFYTS